MPQLLRAGSAALADYLHVPTESALSEEMYLAVDRSDLHLARELDAVLAGLEAAGKGGVGSPLYFIHSCHTC